MSSSSISEMLLTDCKKEVYCRLFQKQAILDREKAWDPLMMKLEEIAKEKNKGKRAVAGTDHRQIYRNPYMVLFPYDSNRVKLEKWPSNEYGYINASHVVFPEVNRKYIMTGSPVQTELGDFWEMAASQKSPAIVMLAHGNDHPMTCTNDYFPKETGDEIRYGDYFVENVGLIETELYVRRTLLVKKGDVAHTVSHFQFLAWNEPTSPSGFDDFLKFLTLTKESTVFAPYTAPTWFAKIMNKEAPSGAPIIQCAAGVNRSGAFIIIDVIIRMLQMGVNDYYSIEHLIMKLQSQRLYGVCSVEMLKFIYECVRHWIVQYHPDMKEVDFLLQEHAGTFGPIQDLKKYLDPKHWLPKQEEREEFLRKNEHRVKRKSVHLLKHDKVPPRKEDTYANMLFTKNNTARRLRYN
ncbi:unnamed protein product [Caenorhabditis sp. 36 PRJEB53466]|nr:unnamed protein product [Caenorhabditis sp. 36 PRJEB53466]